MIRELCDYLYVTMKIVDKVRQVKDNENARHIYAKLDKSVKKLTKDLKRASYKAKNTKNLMIELEMLLIFLRTNEVNQDT